MKQFHLLSAGLIIVTAAAFSSCKPSRVWATKERPAKERKYEDRNNDYDDRYVPTPPPPAPSYVTTALILTPTPGFVMNKYPDGRFYHKSPQGFMYWKGYNNRFYLDRTYLNRIRYDRYEYDQWKENYPAPSYGRR